MNTLLDGIGQVLKWFFDPERKKAVKLDSLEQEINVAVRRRDKALNDNDSRGLVLAISDLLRLREERNRLLQR